jgi:hypothetical protein
MAVVEEMIDVNTGFTVDRAQVRVAAALAGRLGFAMLVHDRSPLDIPVWRLVFVSLVFFSDLSRMRDFITMPVRFVSSFPP